MRAINVEISEVFKKLNFSAHTNFLQLFGELCRQKGYMKIYMFIYIYITFTFAFTLLFFMYVLQNVIWLNTRTGLRYKHHILHAPKYDYYT